MRKGHMTRSYFMQKYWRYYLILEEKFLNTLNYVELAENNMSTYSNEFAHLIQAVGAELDAFFKVYCEFNLNDRKTIADYAKYILKNDSGITKQEIDAQYYDVSFAPFEGWDVEKASQTLTWWEAFVQIKHSRVLNRESASLKNTMYILGALYFLEIKFLDKITKETKESNRPDIESSIFLLKDWEYNHTSLRSVQLPSIGDSIIIDGGGV